VSGPRAVRIPRARTSPAASTTSSEAPAAPSTSVERRKNQAALERAHRLTAIYLGTLVVLYAVFVVLDRSAAGGSTPAVQTGLISFSLIAAAIGALGAYVALSPAPRAVEIRPDAFVVIEWWGRRRTFPPLPDLDRSVVRRYPSSFLSSRDVEAVEVGSRARGRRTYQFEAGLLPAPPATPVHVAG
jgi:hypothetical protein